MLVETGPVDHQGPPTTSPTAAAVRVPVPPQQCVSGVSLAIDGLTIKSAPPGINTPDPGSGVRYAYEPRDPATVCALRPEREQPIPCENARRASMMQGCDPRFNGCRQNTEVPSGARWPSLWAYRCAIAVERRRVHDEFVAAVGGHQTLPTDDQSTAESEPPEVRDRCSPGHVEDSRRPRTDRLIHG